MAGEHHCVRGHCNCCVCRRCWCSMGLDDENSRASGLLSPTLQAISVTWDASEMNYLTRWSHEAEGASCLRISSNTLAIVIGARIKLHSTAGDRHRRRYVGAERSRLSQLYGGTVLWICHWEWYHLVSHGIIALHSSRLQHDIYARQTSRETFVDKALTRRWIYAQSILPQSRRLMRWEYAS
jgi:hypothetical protein